MILLAIIFLGTIGALSAIILFVVSKKFEVYEDPRINQIQEILPAANCGGCGYPGCSGFAVACVKADNLEGLVCPVGGNNLMQQVAEVLGKAAVVSEPKIAVVKCNGTCECCPRINQYDGVQTCAIVSSLYSGETGCAYGCLGFGDCISVCTFDAIAINPETLLPEVNEEKCTGCGICVKTCPKLLIELRKKGPKSRRIYVNCSNKDKGVVAKKACEVACIACSKCQKVCTFEAITITNNLAYIDDDKCRLCRKCVKECPTFSIAELNFPPKKEKTEVC